MVSPFNTTKSCSTQNLPIKRNSFNNLNFNETLWNQDEEKEEHIHGTAPLKLITQLEPLRKASTKFDQTHKYQRKIEKSQFKNYTNLDTIFTQIQPQDSDYRVTYKIYNNQLFAKIRNVSYPVISNSKQRNKV